MRGILLPLGTRRQMRARVAWLQGCFSQLFHQMWAPSGWVWGLELFSTINHIVFLDGDLALGHDVQDAYMKQKHRLIWERREKERIKQLMEKYPHLYKNEPVDGRDCIHCYTGRYPPDLDGRKVPPEAANQGNGNGTANANGNPSS